MRIIAREHIDTKRWDQLVQSGNYPTPFSETTYLDSVAEQWCVAVNADYTAGMALPFTRRAGQEILYTPIFIRYLEYFGDPEHLEAVWWLIEQRFKIVQLAMDSKIGDGETEEYVFQLVEPNDNLTVSSQASRSIKKALQFGLRIELTKEYKNISTIIHGELTDKFTGLNKRTMLAFDRLLENYSREGRLLCFAVKNDSTHGGIICLESKGRLMYLKGAVADEIKRQGGMYLAMSSAINYAREHQLIFDFGGSRVAGVRAFNLNLGGKDTIYYYYQQNKGPVWFKFAKQVKNIWTKK